MKLWVNYAFAAVLLVAAAACNNDTTAPSITSSPVAQSNVGEEPGSYIVLLRDAKSAAKISSDVRALGGNVTFVHAPTGFVLVDGLTSSAAASLGNKAGVQDVLADAPFKIKAPEGITESLPVGDAPMSQLNPATAILYSWQWNMRSIGANVAWAAGKLGSPLIRVAIIDSGIDYDALDLNGLVDLTRSKSFVPKDDSIATLFFPTRNKSDDFNGHGTNVATQASSKALALAGVTSRTTLMSVKVIDWQGSGFLGRSLAGLLFAADTGAHVANLSLGGVFDRAGAKGLNSIVNKVMNYVKQKGVLVVVAAGNSETDLDNNGSSYSSYCDAPHVICVSAVGPVVASGSPDLPAFYTNYGLDAIDVAAPGGNANQPPTLSAWPWGSDIASWIWSLCAKRVIASYTPPAAPVLTACTAGNRLLGGIGTSQASPHVAGLAALLMAEGYSWNETRDRIMSRAVDIGPAGPDAFTGKGRISVPGALGL